MVRNFVQNIVRHDLCAGCGICQSIAGPAQIQVRMNAAGYLRPQVRKTVPDDKLRIIRDVCPGSRVLHAHIDPHAQKHPVWGPYLAIRTGFSSDPAIRFNGASGGAISAILIHLLRRGEIAFAAQIGADPANPLLSAPRLSRTPEQVMACAGSRYAPSAPLTELRRLLDGGEPFAFVGKPCDVSALRRYALHDARVGRQIKVMLSFMCAGVPSIQATHAMIRKMGVDPADVQSLRYRGEGWPGWARITRTDGSQAQMSYEESWGTILTHHLQFRCKICPDGVGEFADIACADAWECDEAGYPTFTERDGRSLILTRTAAGERLLGQCRRDGALVIDSENVPPQTVRAMQPYQFYRKTVLAPRYLAVRLWGGACPEVSLPSLLAASRCQSLSRHVRQLLGTLKRLAGARLKRRSWAH